MSRGAKGRVAYRDSSLGLTIYAPIRPGDPGADGSWRVSYTDPATGRRRQPRWRGTRDEVIRRAKRLSSDIEKRRTSDWREVTFRQLVDRYLDDQGAGDDGWEPQVARNQRRACHLLRDETFLGGETLETLGMVAGDAAAGSPAASDRVHQRPDRAATRGILAEALPGPARHHPRLRPARGAAATRGGADEGRRRAGCRPGRQAARQGKHARGR